MDDDHTSKQIGGRDGCDSDPPSPRTRVDFERVEADTIPTFELESLSHSETDRRIQKSNIETDLEVANDECKVHVIVNNIEQQNYLRRRKSPLLIIMFYTIGVVFSVAHIAFYASLNKKVVGNPRKQQEIIIFGNILSVLSQVSLTASLWQTYSQWIWRSLKRIDFELPTLNRIFSADTSLRWMLNGKMFRKFKVGYLIALLGWYVETFRHKMILQLTPIG